jgi:hypothetical protein
VTSYDICVERPFCRSLIVATARQTRASSCVPMLGVYHSINLPTVYYVVGKQVAALHCSSQLMNSLTAGTNVAM